MSRVVIHHALHPDEGENGIYRLIHAEEVKAISHEAVPCEKRVETVKVPNPHFRPAPAEPTYGVAPPDDREPHEWDEWIEQEMEFDEGVELVERVETFYGDEQEVVWDAGDPKWRGMSDEAIAAEQRQAVTEAMARRAELAKEERRAASERAAKVSHFETGHEL